MFKNKKGMSEKFISRTKIYLFIIAVLFVTIFIYDRKFIIPGSLIYTLILFYTRWVENKRTVEISNHVQELLITMDSTAKKTLINSPFPLIIIETDGNIIWKSSKFVYEFANIDIKNYIDDLIKEIKIDIENKENNEKNRTVEKQIKIGNNIYKVLGEYVKSKKNEKNREAEYMTMLYFIDITDQIKTDEKYQDSIQCIGIITIDNSEEIMQRISSEDRLEISSKIEKYLYNWASETNGLIVKNDRNTFIYLFDYKYLKSMKENKFEILDKIKEINFEGTGQITLSIAISSDGESNYEKYESALACMDIVLGRGGDQAVIKENGKYHFFGGKALEMEKRTKIKARMFSHSLEELIKNSENIMIMGHHNGDMDSIGSSIGIYRLAKDMKKNAYIVNNLDSPAIKDFIEILIEDDNQYEENIIDKNEALSIISENTLLIIVDTHKNDYVEVPELLEKTSQIVIIDHHRRSTNYIENALLTFQEVYASSAAELVTEILQYAETKVELRTIEVEALYAGIMLDTKNFTFKTGVRTFEAAAFLRRSGIDIIKVKKWFQSDLETYKEISKIVEKAEIIRNSIAISTCEENENVAVMCAKAADELLTISDITVSFVIGKIDNKVYISGRSMGDINVQLIMEKLGGGGHITLAGAQIENVSVEDAKQKLIEKISEYFDENM